LIAENERRLRQSIRHSIETQRQKVGAVLGKLDSLSPLSILQRGYSITRRIPSLQILRDAAHVETGDRVEVRLHRGILICGIERAERS
jgi:exodeoxyribonuclease VII large subunit